MKLLLALFLLAMAVIPATSAEIKNSNDLIKAMHDKYQNKWYKTLTFVQTTTDYKVEGKPEVNTWYEAMTLPDKLRIDFGGIGNGNGVIFNSGMQHSFKDGKVIDSRKAGHPLLLLGFSVYGQPVEDTLKQLADMKFDLTKFREDVWQGRSVYVVGAEKDDLHSKQFWIDKKNLYFLRSMQPAGKDGSKTNEIRFADYRKMKSGGWVAARVEFMLDGKMTLLEEYTDIKTNIKLADTIFDPQNLSIKSYEK